MITIKPYKMGSRSAKMMQDSIKMHGVPCLRSRHRGIRWGAAISKLIQLETLYSHDVSCIPFTDDLRVAQAWVGEGQEVVCRTLLRSHSGRGIVLANSLDSLVDAPLYTLYIPKDSEWRVHVCYGCILIQKKMKRKEWDGKRNPKIRNLGNGYIYGRRFKKVPIPIIETSFEAVKALNLDMGAVDIIWNKREQQEYVLEVNTSPGLCKSTADFYAQCIVEKHT